METVDLTHLHWDTNNTGTSGTGGTYYKTTEGIVENNIYYKMSRYDEYLGTTIGYESTFEVIVYRLCQMLGIPSLRYELIKANICINGKYGEYYITASKEYKKSFEKKCSFGDFMLATGYINPLELCRDYNFMDVIEQMFFIDYVVGNRDRHSANIEVLKSSKGFRLAPLFDNGASFVAPQGNSIELIKNFNVLSEIFGNNEIGSKKLSENLNLISKGIKLNNLKNNFEDILMNEIYESMPEDVWSTVLNMIERRYKYAIRKIFSS